MGDDPDRVEPESPNASLEVTVNHLRVRGGPPNPEHLGRIAVGEDPVLLDATDPREMLVVFNWGPYPVDILKDDRTTITESRPHDRETLIPNAGPIWARAKHSPA